MIFLFMFWLVGWVAMMIYTRWRVMVNYHAGFIANPNDPIANFSMAIKCMAWFYLAPKIAYLWWREG